MEIKHRAVRGVMWVGLSSVTVQALKFISRVALARLLFPSDFGLMAIGLLIMNGLSLVRDMGIGTALVYQKERMKEAASTAFWIVPPIGLILFFFSYISAPIIANFYGQAEVGRIIRILSFTFLIYPFEMVPSALLSKELEFKRRFIPEVISELTYTILAITLASAGFGVWSLAYGYISSTIVNALLMWHVCKWRPSFYFEWGMVRELMNYGKHVIFTNILAFIFLQGDKAFISKMVSTSEMGYYTMAYMLANLPSLYVTHIISRVAFSTFCKLQDDIPMLRQAYFKAMKFCLLLIIPVCIGGIIATHDIVKNILGDKWLPMVFVFKLLCFSTIMRSVHIISGFLFQAVGRPDLEKNLLFVETILILILLYPLIKIFGIFGAAMAVTFVITLGGSWSLWRALRFVKAQIYQIGTQMKTIVRAAFVMAIAVALFKLLVMPVNKTSLPGLILLVATGAVCYIISVYNKDLFLELRDFKNILLDSSNI